MLSKEVEDRIIVVASSNSRQISIQNLRLIAFNYNMEDAYNLMERFCVDNHISIFDEVADDEAAEAAAAGSVDKEDIIETDINVNPEAVEKTTQNSVKLFIDSLVFSERTALLEELLKTSNSMTLREVKLIAYRHGLIDGTRHTLDETIKEFGVYAERIRQIESKLLRSAHYRPNRSKKLKEFLESS